MNLIISEFFFILINTVVPSTVDTFIAKFRERKKERKKVYFKNFSKSQLTICYNLANFYFSQRFPKRKLKQLIFIKNVTPNLTNFKCHLLLKFLSPKETESLQSCNFTLLLSPKISPKVPRIEILKKLRSWNLIILQFYSLTFSKNFFKNPTNRDLTILQFYTLTFSKNFTKTPTNWDLKETEILKSYNLTILQLYFLQKFHQKFHELRF